MRSPKVPRKLSGSFLVQHVYGSARTCQDPPAIFSDSQAAINIGSTRGLLRRVRHVDLRVCWVQSTRKADFVVLGAGHSEQ